MVVKFWRAVAIVNAAAQATVSTDYRPALFTRVRNTNTQFTAAEQRIRPTPHIDTVRRGVQFLPTVLFDNGALQQLVELKTNQ